MDQNNVEDLIAVDLHVHTPFSKCYRVNGYTDIDDEYIKLLELYVEKNIKVIAITDHNSIGGYKHLMKMKKEAQDKVKLLEEFSHLEEIKQKIERENYKLELFNKICIFPGIEFEANPGVHLLLIFNKEEFNSEKSLERLENFLEENGYPKEMQGIENPEISKKSAIDIIESARSLGAITIAAHVESSKGALQNIPNGKARVQFFKSDSLMAIQVVSLNKIDYIKDLYRKSEYKRESIPAFIRCSDYHNKDLDIEKCVTYMRISELTFESIKDAIINNNECISFTKNPDNEDIIRNVIEQNQTYTVDELDEDSCEQIKKYICCILNSGSGNIVIGVSDNKSIVGIKKPKEDFESFIKKALNSYTEFKAFFRYGIQYYDYGNHLIVVLSIRSIKKMIYNLNNKVYLKRDNIIVEAAPNDLVKIGEENFREGFKEINNRNKYAIDKINKELNRIKLLENNINLYIKVNNSSLKLKDISNVNLVESNIRDMEEIEVLSPGYNYGSVYGICHNRLGEEAHNKDYYKRITCPRMGNHIVDIKSKDYKEECIIISIGGTTYYIEGKESYKIATKLPVLMITLKDEFKEAYSLRSIIAWLKSPILLSFLDLVYGRTDLFHPKIISNIPIVMNEITKKGGQIESFTNYIIEEENKFLEKFNELEEKQCSEEEKDALIDNHNKDISIYACKIEEYIKSILEIQSEENYIISEFINEKGWEKVFLQGEIGEEEAK